MRPLWRIGRGELRGGEIEKGKVRNISATVHSRLASFTIPLAVSPAVTINRNTDGVFHSPGKFSHEQQQRVRLAVVKRRKDVAEGGF